MKKLKVVERKLMGHCFIQIRSDWVGGWVLLKRRTIAHCAAVHARPRTCARGGGVQPRAGKVATRVCVWTLGQTSPWPIEHITVGHDVTFNTTIIFYKKTFLEVILEFTFSNISFSPQRTCIFSGTLQMKRMDWLNKRGFSYVIFYY